MNSQKLHDQMMHIIHHEFGTLSGQTKRIPIPPELVAELGGINPKYDDDLTLILEQYINGLSSLLKLMRLKSLYDLATKALPGDTENLAGTINMSQGSCGLITTSQIKHNELNELYDKFYDLYRSNMYPNIDDINVEYCKEHMEKVKDIIKTHVAKIKTPN